MNKIKYLVLTGSAALATNAVHAADYADIDAAKTAVTGIPATVSPVYLAFLTLSVGAFIIGMVVRYARRGSSTK